MVSKSVIAAAVASIAISLASLGFLGHTLFKGERNGAAVPAFVAPNEFNVSQSLHPDHQGDHVQGGQSIQLEPIETNADPTPSLSSTETPLPIETPSPIESVVPELATPVPTPEASESEIPTPSASSSETPIVIEAATPELASNEDSPQAESAVPESSNSSAVVETVSSVSEIEQQEESEPCPICQESLNDNTNHSGAEFITDGSVDYPVTAEFNRFASENRLDLGLLNFSLSCQHESRFHPRCRSHWAQSRIIEEQVPNCPLCRHAINWNERIGEVFTDHSIQKMMETPWGYIRIREIRNQLIEELKENVVRVARYINSGVKEDYTTVFWDMRNPTGTIRHGKASQRIMGIIGLSETDLCFSPKFIVINSKGYPFALSLPK